ncbi:accessory gene regulator ArgB-like protein [Sediminibacillus albus]|uniref:Accessory gene regulator protein AgrB n=1 Tax=Sediminibacillus albus TaxID=407036 RepID=A0A1G9A3C8_9BACI|nr:Accessory gene regulator protein AgrB [Sediminibacillus albus]
MNINLNTLSVSLANLVTTYNPNLKQQEDYIRYGLEWILSGLFQTLLILTVSYLLNLTPFSLVSLVTGAIFRMLTGGVHFNTYIKCVYFSSTIIIIVAFVSKLYSKAFNHWSLYYGNVVLLFIIYYLYAPKLYKTKTLFSQKQKERFKLLSILLLIIFFLLTEFLVKDYRYILCIWISIFFQGFSLTNCGEKVILYIDNITKLKWRKKNGNLI